MWPPAPGGREAMPLSVTLPDAVFAVGSRHNHANVSTRRNMMHARASSVFSYLRCNEVVTCLAHYSPVDRSMRWCPFIRHWQKQSCCGAKAFCCFFPIGQCSKNRIHELINVTAVNHFEQDSICRRTSIASRPTSIDRPKFSVRSFSRSATSEAIGIVRFSR